MELTLTEQQVAQLQYLHSLLFDTVPLFETNVAGFLSFVSKKYTTEGQSVDVVPLVVTEFLDVEIFDNLIVETLMYSLLGIMKQAHPVPTTGNDFTVVDYGAVETQDVATSQAKTVLLGTQRSLHNILQWHVINNTHIQFQNLFYPIPVLDELLEEDEFIVLKYFEPNENARLFAVDITQDKLRIATSPHVKARMKRVRKSLIANTQEQFHIEHRYQNQGETK
jgi:hypothetical protein